MCSGTGRRSRHLAQAVRAAVVPCALDGILEETVRTLQNKLGLNQEQSAHLVDELRTYFPDAWVEPGYRELIPVMKNDEKDRHVLAAAVKASCEVIITYNLKHFPDDALKPHGIMAKHPDEFLVDLYYVNGEMVIHELHQQGASLAKPRSIDEVLTSLEICQCRQFVKLIREKLQ